VIAFATRMVHHRGRAAFANIQCCDKLRVNALLNEIAGKTHNRAPAMILAVFGMNFQLRLHWRASE
jgi:hypothetical protein